MKKWPKKILLTSLNGFEKFVKDANNYFASKGIVYELECPKKFPCVVVGVEHSEERHGDYEGTYNYIDIIYVYLTDF